MLTYEQAKKRGMDACVEKMGRSFVDMHKDNLCYGASDVDEYAYCFLGVDDKPDVLGGKRELILDSTSKWPYVAKCHVWYSDGKIDFYDCVLPT